VSRWNKVVVIMGLFGIGAALAALARHWSSACVREMAGGVVMDDVSSYDRMSRLLLGSLFSGIALDAAQHGTASDHVLEVGCGPGHLSLRLARDHGLRVTGLDLDPGMIEQACTNAARYGGDSANLDFVVADVAALPFADASFDLVVSTMSMHHWDDPPRGLAEIARVLRPGGRALIWDLRAGGLPFHRHVPDPASNAQSTALRLVSETAWRWPGPLALTRRVEFLRDAGRR